MPGIRVVVEVGLGLGVFAGDAIGIGHSVRQLSAAGECTEKPASGPEGKGGYPRGSENGPLGSDNALRT